METKPVVQNFLGTPVRVYRTEFQVEMTPHNTGSSSRFFTLQTFAIPLPDFSEAVGYRSTWISDLINRSTDVFAGLWRTEQIPDALGRMRSTILLSQEMVDGLVFKLHASRIKDPATRVRVVEFQRFVMLTIGLIRRRKLLPVHDADLALGDVPPAYRNMLTLVNSSELANMVRDQAVAEGKSFHTIYRKLNKFRGSNTITHTGHPRRRRGSLKEQ